MKCSKAQGFGNSVPSYHCYQKPAWDHFAIVGRGLGPHRLGLICKPALPPVRAGLRQKHGNSGTAHVACNQRCTEGEACYSYTKFMLGKKNILQIFNCSSTQTLASRFPIFKQWMRVIYSQLSIIRYHRVLTNLGGQSRMVINRTKRCNMSY